MTTSRLRCLVTAAVVGSASLFAGAPVIAGPASPGVTVYAPGTAGVAPVSGQSVASHTQSSSTLTPSTRPKGARSFPVAGGSASTTQQAPAAAASSSTAASTLLHNFNGVSSLDSAKTNFGAQFEPPDQGLCEGNGFVLEAVNSAYRIYTTGGKTILGPFNVNDLFNVGAAEFTSDPRCHYDPTTNTWFLLILFISSDSQSSSFDIAVSTSGDPTKSWTQYRFDTTNSGGNGCPCFGDQPRIGIDQYNIYVSTDEFSILGPQFNGGQVYAISKSDLVGGLAAHFFHFGNLTIAGIVPGAVEPAISTGTPNAEYFMNSIDPTGTSDNRIGVWAMTDREAVAAGDSPELSSTVITSEPFGVPPKALQKGSTSTLDSGDDRMQQTQFIGGNIWGELTTSVPSAIVTGPHAGAAWFTVTPSLSGEHIGAAVIKHQGYVTTPSDDVIYPALQANASGNAAIVFTLTGNDRFPSAAYAALGTGQTSFGAPIVAASGTEAYDPSATRWGDYSWAVLDPATNSVWLAIEYMPPESSQTHDGLADWGTRVLNVRVS